MFKEGCFFAVNSENIKKLVFKGLGLGLFLDGMVVAPPLGKSRGSDPDLVP
jgi:hypothetical protein